MSYLGEQSLNILNDPALSISAKTDALSLLNQLRGAGFDEKSDFSTTEFEQPALATPWRNPGTAPGYKQQSGGFFSGLVNSIGGFGGLLDLAKGGLQVAGAIRSMNAKPENPMDNPAIQSLLQQRAQIDAYARAIADENDPLRKRMLENNMAALQRESAGRIRELEKAVSRRIASGRPALGGGIIPGNDPRRRDETIAGLTNQLAGIQIPNAAHAATLQQLQGAAQAASGGPSAANAINPIQEALNRNRLRDQDSRQFGGLIEVLNQIGGLGKVSGGGVMSGGQGQNTIGSGNPFGSRGGINYAGVSNKYNLFGVV